MSQLTHYQEITIIPNPEIAPYFIWSQLFTQLHIGLADIKNKHGTQSIGVSFPDYHYDDKGKSSKLGLKLRVFAPSQQDLETLNLVNWLSRLTDYVHIKRISDVGDKAKGNVVVNRYRPKNMLKQAEEFAKYKDISLDAALVHCAAYKQDNKLYPYISLKSISNKQPYPLSIVQQAVDDASQGAFNSYGINNAADKVTVPHW
ncbi:type I-F CRISPR-associated endoribonuclease Cas6/Csy4 [Psychrobacter urativorans]|uniref:type I-F CRISPR-associated endoribonuclease Cas6/Csy4 n=1 Tax=Psychrobacter urativorans TaxID=45610 RepID=UPI00191822DA|nr:type I-F CRISPR-associated endoribonuclease Cas6/Csy4 [Psychrobacter urativorans]